MSIFNETITEEDGQKLKAYIAKPKGDGPWPALIMLHEVYGVNSPLKAVADQFAQKGFIVACPNMYWRHNDDASFEPVGAGQKRTQKQESDRNEARELMFEKLDHSNMPKDIKIVADYLKSLDDCNGRVGAMGFCLGAKAAYLSAVNDVVDCAAPFYPTPDFASAFNKEKSLSSQVPMMFVIAGSDGYIARQSEKDELRNVSSQFIVYASGLSHPVIENNAHGNENIITHYYSANDHGFGRLGGEHYDQIAADHAYGLTAEFLTSALNGKAIKKFKVSDIKTPLSDIYDPKPKR